MSELFFLACIPVLAFAAQWCAWRTGLPSILLLLVGGVGLGSVISSDPVGIIGPANHNPSAQDGNSVLFSLVSLAVAVIMYEGGLSLKLSELRESGASSIRLCTIGAVATFLGTTVAALAIFGFPWRVCFLLGAILVVTGPTVIGPLLRQVQPNDRVANTLKWEGIVSDPIGAILAVLVFELLFLHPEQAGVSEAILILLKTIAIGMIAGTVAGFFVSKALARYLIPDHLHGFAALSLVLLLFAACDQLAHESGLIAVTVLGIWMSNQKGVDVEHIIEFKENLRTILIGCLFIVLGARVDLPALSAVALPGIGFIAALVLLIRPLSVSLSLVGTGLSLQERSFIGAIAPRGIVAAAVSSVFALRMEQLENVDAASGQLVNVVFLAILGTVTVYGLTASVTSRVLGLSSSDKNGVLLVGADDWVIGFAKELKALGIRVLIVDTNFSKITKARLEGIEAICANVMNEHVREELPLRGIGNFLSVTPNDQINSLAVREYRSRFGRSHTFQIGFSTEGKRGMTKNMMGRELFGEGVNHSQMTHWCESGYEFKTTSITEEFSLDDFERTYPNYRLLATTSESGKLNVVTSDDSGESRSIEKIVALVRIES